MFACVWLATCISVVLLQCRTYIFGEQRVCTESTTFAIVVGVKNDQNVLDCDHQRDGPQNEGQSPKQIGVAGRLRECRRKHIERRCTDVAIDDTRRLVRENEDLCETEGL